MRRAFLLAKGYLSDQYTACSFSSADSQLLRVNQPDFWIFPW
jgi:hypothetical protein